MPDATAAIAANRFGLGARPGELAEAGRDARGWLRAQLVGAPRRLPSAGLTDSASTLRRAAELRGARAAQRASGAPAAGRDGGSSTDVAGTALRLGATLRPIYLDEVAARLGHAVRTDRSFLERLTQFWTNHFAVSIDKLAVLGIAGAFEREAIRPHVLGRFADLLLAVERHPAMLLYLDNHLSIGPSSRAAAFVARRGAAAAGGATGAGRRVGINENLAREILELHTLGVDGGYSQDDVTTFAKVLSGWSIGGTGPRGGDRLAALLGDDAEHAGRFLFREAFHEPGARTLLGRTYRQDAAAQGEAVLRDLALAPATARHLATKLARHFIADDPPAAAVERLASAFTRSDGDLPTVYRALVDAPEAWAQPLAKFKTPADYVHSTYRALDVPVEDGRRAVAPFELLGQRPFSPGSPAGWPDRAADWDGSSALLQRLEWADAVGQRLGGLRNASQLAGDVLGGALAAPTRAAIARAAGGSQALTLLLAAPEFMRR
jgi:uncharacterized protein (DUF1800 family)